MAIEINKHQSWHPIEKESSNLMNRMTTRTSLHISYSKVMTVFQGFLFISHRKEKAITSLSPFVIEKQIKI